MKIVIKFQNGREEEREWKVGQTMVGIRITKIILESMAETLAFIDNPEWVKANVAYRHVKN